MNNISLTRLSAAEEIQLEQRAQDGFHYLKLICRSGVPHFAEDCLWAAANNAALLSLSLKRCGRWVFKGVTEVLCTMSLTKIAQLADQYQRKYEGRRERIWTRSKN